MDTNDQNHETQPDGSFATDIYNDPAPEAAGAPCAVAAAAAAADDPVAEAHSGARSEAVRI